MGRGDDNRTVGRAKEEQDYGWGLGCSCGERRQNACLACMSLGSISMHTPKEKRSEELNCGKTEMPLQRFSR